MKNLSIIAVVMLSVGFALGWISKPAPSNQAIADAHAKAVPSAASVAANATGSPSESAPPPGKRAIRENEGKKRPGMPDQAEIEKQSKKMQADMMKAMVDRTRTKLTQRIDQLVEKLNLSPEQKNLMTAALATSLAELEKIDFSDPSSFAKFTSKTDWMPTENGLLGSVQASLTAEQKESLTALQGVERRNKADTLALKNLSKLQGIVPLEEGQRDEVYKILTATAEAGVDAESDKPDPTAFFTDGMGMDMDPYDLGLTRLMTDITPDMKAGNPGDPKQVMTAMREAINKRIDAKVEQLRPVLNDKQLGIYRNELKTKGMGFYGQAFGEGMGAEETIIIK